MGNEKEKSGNALVFLGYMDDPVRVIQRLKYACDNAINPDKYGIICMNELTAEEKRKGGLGIAHFEEFLGREDYVYMEGYVLNLSKNWHKPLYAVREPESKGAAETAGILRLDMYIALSTAVRNLHVILNAVSLKKPSEIILIGEREEDELKAISAFLNKGLNIRASYIKARLFSVRQFLFSAIKNIPRFLADLASEFLDRIEMLYLAKTSEYKNAILIDRRIAHVVDCMEKEERPINYTVEKGLKLRLRFLKNRMPYFSFRKTRRPLCGAKALKHFRRLEGGIKKAFVEREDFLYKNHCIYEALNGILRKFTENIISLSSDIRVIREFFGAVRPKILVLRDSVRREECAMTSVARLLGIPSLVIQHGLETLPNVYSAQNADAMAFWGRAHAEWFKSYGTDVSRSRVTGNPCYDRLYHRSPGRLERYRAILQSINADPEKPTIVYLGNCIEYHPTNSVYVRADLSLSSLRITLNVFKEFSGNAQLVVKLHPYHTRGAYAALFKKEVSKFSNVFLSQNADIADLFSGAAFVITELFSTAILEAAILKKPIIFYNFAKRKEPIPLKETGVALEAKDRNELEMLMRDMLYGKGNSRPPQIDTLDGFIKDYAYKVDGRSSERVRGLIRELMRK